MRKILVVASIVSLVTVGLTACTPGNNTPGSTLVGAAAGGLLAGSLFHGSGDVAGILAGTLIGGGIGYMAGRYMDRQDQVNMQNAIVNTPVGQDASWTNSDSHVTYHVQPVRNYSSQGNYCREYRTRVNIGGTWRTAFGKACRMPDGQWRIVR